jgi:hypothetical protein
MYTYSGLLTGVEPIHRLDSSDVVESSNIWREWSFECNDMDISRAWMMVVIWLVVVCLCVVWLVDSVWQWYCKTSNQLVLWQLFDCLIMMVYYKFDCVDSVLWIYKAYGWSIIKACSGLCQYTTCLLVVYARGFETCGCVLFDQSNQPTLTHLQ